MLLNCEQVIIVCYPWFIANTLWSGIGTSTLGRKCYRWADLFEVGNNYSDPHPGRMS